MGVVVSVSEAPVGAVKEQFRDAVEFLTHNSEEIRRLAQVPGVQDLRLDFAVSRTSDLVTQSTYLPPHLLALAGSLGVGIELSSYVTDEDDPSADDRKPGHVLAPE